MGHTPTRGQEHDPVPNCQDSLCCHERTQEMIDPTGEWTWCINPPAQLVRHTWYHCWSRWGMDLLTCKCMTLCSQYHPSLLLLVRCLGFSWQRQSAHWMYLCLLINLTQIWWAQSTDLLPAEPVLKENIPNPEGPKRLKLLLLIILILLQVSFQPWKTFSWTDLVIQCQLLNLETILNDRMCTVFSTRMTMDPWAPPML